MKEIVEKEKSGNGKTTEEKVCPRLEEGISIQISIVISPEKYRLLQKHAEQRSPGVSSLIREIIDDFLLKASDF